MAMKKRSKLPCVLISRNNNNNNNKNTRGTEDGMLTLLSDCKRFEELKETQRHSLRSLVAQQTEAQKKATDGILKKCRELGINSPEQFLGSLEAKETLHNENVSEGGDLNDPSAGASTSMYDVKELIIHIEKMVDQKLQATVNNAVASVMAEVTALRKEMTGGHVERQSAMVSIQSPPIRQQPKRPDTFSEAVHHPPTKSAHSSRPITSNRTPLTNGELECFFTKRPLNGLARATLYFRGLGRHDIWKVRRLFVTLEIPPQAVQFISFIGASVTEMIVIDSFKEEVIRRLATVNVQCDATFNPLSPNSFTDTATIERLGLTTKSEAEKLDAAKQAFIARMESMLRVIAHHRHGLRSFVRALRNAVENGTPIDHYFDPALRPCPTLTFDISKTRAFIETFRSPSQEALGSVSVSGSSNTDTRIPRASGLGSKRLSSGSSEEDMEVVQSSPVGLPSGKAAQK